MRQKTVTALLFLLVSAGACSYERQGTSNTAPVPVGTIDDQLIGAVVSLHDGDTLTVYAKASEHKIRLAGIDAPESNQPFGMESKQFLLAQVLNREVTVITHKVDQHGRSVGKVICNGIDINLELLKGGLAWHYKQYQNEQSPIDREAYAEAEINARAANRGLWADPKPIPPWEWRQGKDEENIQGVPKGSIIGNNNSMIYHTPGCSTYGKVSPQNQVIFKNIQEAEAAGFRRAKNCKGG